MDHTKNIYILPESR